MIKFGSKKPREGKNEAKGGQERLRDAKMEAQDRLRRPKRLQESSAQSLLSREVSTFGAPSLAKESKILKKRRSKIY